MEYAYGFSVVELRGFGVENASNKRK